MLINLGTRHRTANGPAALGENESDSGASRCCVRQGTFPLTAFPLVDLFAIDGYVGRCLDADADLVAFDSENLDGNSATDLQRLAGAPGENQHDVLRVEWRTKQKTPLARDASGGLKMAIETLLRNVGIY